MRKKQVASFYLTSVAAATLAMVAVPPAAQAQEQTFRFSIPAGGLDGALRAFARASRQQVTFESETVAGKQSPALNGQYSVRAALDILLAGSGLVAEGVRPGLFVIRPARETNVPAETPASASNVDEIVVTGSRIAQTGYNTPSPVAVTGPQQIARTGVSNLYDVLNRSPQFSVGVGPASAEGYLGEVGASFVNLRGLGTNRTLVLINGQRRVSGASTTSAVDLSSIPAGMVQRIEVVTGGAAAVYGADAVSGVVNVFLKDQIDGLEINARQGLSSHGDASSYSLGALLGGRLGDRGRVTVGFSYNHDDSLFQRQRGFTRNYVNLEPNPANTGPNDGIPDNLAFNNSRFPNTTYSGAFAIGGTRYTYDGALRPLRNDSLPYGPTSYLGVGGDGFNGADFNGLRPEVGIISALTHLTYEVSDSINLTSDLQFSQNRSNQQLQPLFGFAYPITRDNPFVPAPVASLMDANGLSSITVGRTDVDQGLNSRDITRTTFTGLFKLDGKITPSISWQAFAQYGRFENKDIFRNERITSRFNEALDVVQGPAGPMCRSATARAAGCQPLNIFGLNVATPQALAYFHHDPITYTSNSQTVAGGQLSGNLFSLPAGPLAFSAGLEYRRETTEVQADTLASQGALYYGHGGNLTGEFDVKEAFAEVLVPLLRDVSFAKSLDFNGAIRESDYSTIGRTTTWKAGLVYAPIDDVRVRVTQSRSVRAPNLSELFNAGVQSQVAYLDPCDITQISSAPNRAANCRALGIPAGFRDPLSGTLRFANTSGNPNLRAEVSNSTTVGVVVQPRFLGGFSASVDYFDIRIKGAINTLPVDNILSGCVAGAAPTALLCNQINRRADGGISFVRLAPLNIGQLQTRGLDLAADYRFGAGDIAGEPLRLALSFAGSYYMKNDALVDASHPEDTLHYAGSVTNPKFRGNLTASAQLGAINASWTARYISPAKVDLNVSDEYRSENNLGRRLYNDIYVTYDVNEKVRLGAGINNVFNVKPPYSFVTYTGTGVGSLYDNIGTSFFVTAGLKL